MTILIVNAAEWGDAHARQDYPKDVGQWFIDAVEAPDRSYEIWEVQKQETPPISSPSAVYLSGSSCSVYDPLPWIGHLDKAVRQWRDQEIPMMGVCFGHQLIAQTFGGRVEKHPGGWEVGVEEIELTKEGTDDPLFEGLPPRFPVMQSHQDVVVELPEGAVALAGNAHAPFQSFSLGDRIRTVQFHPEYTPDHIRFLLSPRQEMLSAAGVDFKAMIAGIRETMYSRSLLRRFLDHFVEPQDRG